MTGPDFETVIAQRLRAADALLHADAKADASAVSALIETLERDRRRRRGYVRMAILAVIFVSGLVASLLLPLATEILSDMVGEVRDAAAEAPTTPLASMPAFVTAFGLMGGLGLLVLVLQTATD